MTEKSETVEKVIVLSLIFIGPLTALFCILLRLAKLI